MLTLLKKLRAWLNYPILEFGAKMQRHPVDLVRKVTVVSEDLVGPLHNSLFVELVDGKYIALDRRCDIEQFLADLRRYRPSAAGEIIAALAEVPDICREQVFEIV
jgi:hypothetical protein